MTPQVQTQFRFQWTTHDVSMPVSWTCVNKSNQNLFFSKHANPMQVFLVNLHA